MWQWRINVLGKFYAWSPNGPIGSFRVRKCEELLALLALYPAGKARVDIAAALWPLAPQATQLDKLRYTLSMVRKAYGCDPFVATGNTHLALIPGMCCDALEWRAALSRAMKEPITSRRVELLEDLLSNGPPQLLAEFYTNWADQERHPWNAAVADAVAALAWGLARISSWEPSLRWVRLGEDEFPDREDDWDSIRSYVEEHRETTSDEYFAPKEFYEVRNWLRSSDSENRLITITGPGGIGKTRLARETSAGIELVAVELADCIGLEQVWERLRLALDLGPTNTSEEAVITGLNEPGAPARLFLDNLEQLDLGGSILVSTILRRCPGVSILATSQRKLDISGEHEIPLKHLTDKESFKLFLARARRERADFASYPDAERKVREICELLEGIPLAIELAAARAHLLGPTQIYVLLEDALKFLVTRREELPERHRSVRAALDWSISLLSPSVRQTLGKLSIFQGGCSPEAALEICGETFLDDIEELKRRSLVQVSFCDNERARYNLLYLVKEYIKEKNTFDAEYERRYSEYYCNLPREILSGDFLSDWIRMQELLKEDRNNIISAVNWFKSINDFNTIYELMICIAVHCIELGYWSEGSLIFSAIESAELSPEQRIRYLGFVGALKRRCGDLDNARHVWLQRLELCHQVGDLMGVIDTTMDIGHMECELGDLHKAKMLLDYACVESLKCNFMPVAAECHSIRAKILIGMGDSDTCLENCNFSEKCIEEDFCDFREMYFILNMLSSVYLRIGDLKKCDEISKKLLRIAVEHEMPYHIAIAAELIEEVKKDGVGLRIALAIHHALGSGRRASVTHMWNAWAAHNGFGDWKVTIKDFDWKTASMQLLHSF